MLELIFVLGFFFILLLTGVSVLGVLAALFVATLLMFAGGVLALMIKLLPWLLLAVAAVWIIRAVKKKNNACTRYGVERERYRRRDYRRYSRGRY
ncbi:MULTISPECIES: envelope stress response protein PspG [Tenebrionibacter/Tenebrionicola group]|jgi:phage shock protein G|uniref:Envelope stress response protein PspG n=2 Tax=Tenebrionibacter/Tenebrionicola group TaxID=2969848 RepID=A0A8K0XWS3_9ENTR|nr:MULTISPECIES: envelope stress response protein PspG [Tenebrionibacter/Tenebrionicola group]MBK4714858.1 envelope stress response protein PspG [Tenebrionibacter intestinalis]MBV5095583.1 envelope stress response protein PspG [Tenebrionicola larvae]